MNTVLSSHIARVVLAATIGFATLFGALAAASPTSTNIRAQTIPLSRLLGSESSMARGATSGFTVARRAGGCTNSPDSGGWLTTSGAWVVDAGNNCKVRLEGVNWYGMQTQYYVPAGLDLASFQDVLAEIKSLGFNSVRINLSDQFVKDSDSITIGAKYTKKSPELQGLHPLQALDLLVAQAQQDGLWVILDNHDSAAVTKSQIHSDQKSASPVWTAPGYSQQQWIADWTTLADRYSAGHYCGYYAPAANNCGDVPTVIGFDLRNEPHTSQGAPSWNMKAYLKYGSVWGPCTVQLCGATWTKWWNGEPAAKQASSNWPDAATAAANAILGVNPHLLMIVEGTQLYPAISKKNANGVDSYWWGSILKGVQTDPINLASQQFEQQLVYSPHEWGPWKFDSPQFYSGKAGYSQLAALFTSQWGFILHSKTPHPVWLGEFNTCNLVPGKKFYTKMHSTIPKIKTLVQCTADKRKNSEGLWWSVLIKYLQQNPEVGWSYYPFNPVNSLNGPSNNSLEYTNGKTDQYILKSLDSIETKPPS